jgi:hypothetical protein
MKIVGVMRSGRWFEKDLYWTGKRVFVDEQWVEESVVVRYWINAAKMKLESREIWYFGGMLDARESESNAVLRLKSYGFDIDRAPRTSGTETGSHPAF